MSIKAPVTPGFEDVEKMAEGDEMDKLTEASPQDRVDVSVAELDGRDAVELVRG